MVQEKKDLGARICFFRGAKMVCEKRNILDVHILGAISTIFIFGSASQKKDFFAAFAPKTCTTLKVC